MLRSVMPAYFGKDDSLSCLRIPKNILTYRPTAMLSVCCLDGKRAYSGGLVLTTHIQYVSIGFNLLGDVRRLFRKSSAETSLLNPTLRIGEIYVLSPIYQNEKGSDF